MCARPCLQGKESFLNLVTAKNSLKVSVLGGPSGEMLDGSYPLSFLLLIMQSVAVIFPCSDGREVAEQILKCCISSVSRLIFIFTEWFCSHIQGQMCVGGSVYHENVIMGSESPISLRYGYCQLPALGCCFYQLEAQCPEVVCLGDGDRKASSPLGNVSRKI